MDVLPDPGLLPDTWRIDETPDGWALRWRPPVTGVIDGLPCMRHFFPTWLYGWRGLAAASLGVMIVSVVAGRILGREGNLSARSLGGGAAMQIVLTALHFYRAVEKVIRDFFQAKNLRFFRQLHCRDRVRAIEQAVCPQPAMQCMRRI